MLVRLWVEAQGRPEVLGWGREAQGDREAERGSVWHAGGAGRGNRKESSEGGDRKLLLCINVGYVSFLHVVVKRFYI